MLTTLIQKEMMHHILNARFIALLLMCVLLIPLNFHINYQRYLQRQVDYQEAVKGENSREPAEQPWLERKTTGPNLEVSKLINKMNVELAPLEETARLKYRNLVSKLDRRYQQERKRQDEIGINFSRITPTSSFIFLATDATQTGQVKRNTYFQTGNRYYKMLDTEMFSKMSEAALIETEEIPSPMPPPPITELTLQETLRHAVIDLLLLCSFAAGLTTIAFLKFFRSDI